MPQAVHGWFWTKHKVKVGSIANKKQLTNPGSYTAISDGTTQAIWQDCPGCAECAAHGGLVLRKGAWRCTESFEYVYQLTKTDKYYGDGHAVREDTPEYTFRFRNSGRYVNQDTIPSNDNHNGDTGEAHTLSGRNLRSVWTLSTQGFNLNMCKSCNAIFEQRRFARLPKQNDKRVCTCGASDWLSHFATFCESLVETCIKASTSEYGVCDKCGAPYARIIDEHRNYKSIGTNTTKTGTAIEVGKRYADWYTVETATLGWLQTCECQNPQPVPATVLDCFVGSGTTVLVAQKLGRRGIGYDLSEHYCKLAEYRIRQAGLL
jgi:hypothetical protein